MAKKRDGAGAAATALDYESVLAMANQEGLLENLLRTACEDKDWKRAVERELSNGGPLGKVRTGGARPTDVWKEGLLRRRLIMELRDDNILFRAFAQTHPKLEGVTDTVDPTAEMLLEEHGPVAGLLAVYLCLPVDDQAQALALQTTVEYFRTRQPSEVPCAESAVVVEEASADYIALQERLAAAEEESRLQKREIKDLKAARKELGQSRQQVSRKDQKLTELKQKLATAESVAADATERARALAFERDELRRKAERLKALAESSKKGQRTSEDKREEETTLLQGKVNDFRELLETSNELRSALEKRVTALEAQLQDEQTRRIELEETFAAFGIDDIASSSRSLQAAVETLMQFQRAVGKYAQRQEEQEAERARLLAEAEEERHRAEEARQAREDMNVAWRRREEERLIELEKQLFESPFDHVIIDGHNLVHRVFRPEDEARTRPWLESMVERMAEVLEEYEWSTRIHLVFDTQYNSNMRLAGHGVQVYFHNNVSEGGADAKIASLLDELNPLARIMVVSTDHKHVWTDTLAKMHSEEREVDLVEVELMAQYLQALNDLQ